MVTRRSASSISQHTKASSVARARGATTSARVLAIAWMALAGATASAPRTAYAQQVDPPVGPTPPAGSGPVTRDPNDTTPSPTEKKPSPDTGSNAETVPGSKPGTEAAPPAPATAAPQTTPPTRPVVPPPPGGQSPKRAMPDYDGRGGEPTTAGDVALWVPRILLSPLYLVSEYVIRRPLGWLISTAERKQWPSAIANLFVFGEDKKAGIVPTAFLDLGFRSSVGFYAFWDDLLGKDNHLRMHFSTFGADWLQGAIADKIPVGNDSFFDLRFEGVHRPDQVFHGLGPRTLQKDRFRYGIDRIQVRPVFESTWWRGSRITLEGGVRYMEFRDDRCCDDPSAARAIALGKFPVPPAFDTGYTAFFQRAEITVDTREERPAKQSGLRVEMEVESGSDIRQSTSNWVRYGGTVGGYLDLKNNRTVSLSMTTLFVDPISGGGQIPFTEQIILGGSGLMRGYLPGRLIDRSAAVLTMKYRWPIWVYLDGSIQAALGNVFGRHLEEFHSKLLRLSAAIGVETVGAADHTFEILTGFGTETIDNGFQVNSFRLLFGTNRGF